MSASSTSASTGDAERYPSPGRLIDVGGHRLHLYCVGLSGPTVVFESGFRGSSIDWTLVQQQLSGEARVCQALSAEGRAAMEAFNTSSATQYLWLRRLGITRLVGPQVLAFGRSPRRRHASHSPVGVTPPAVCIC